MLSFQSKIDRFFSARPDPATILSAIDLKASHGAPLRTILRAMDEARDPLYRHARRHLGTSIAAKAFTLKTLNLLLAKYHFAQRSPALLSRPFGLTVDPSNGCNLGCPGCVHSSGAKELKVFEWNKGLLSEDRFSALLEQFGPYALQVMFCNYGEPTANLQTPRFIELAKSYLIRTVLSTNATIGRFDADAYVLSGLDFMFLSIDGATQSVYQQYRKGGQIDVAFENIRKLVEAKKRLGRKTPILRWQFLAFEHNSHEIPMALQLAKELGVDQFSVDIPFDVSWDDPRIRPAKDVKPSTYELIPQVAEAFRENWNFDLKGVAKEAIEREYEKRWEQQGESYPSLESKPPGHTCPCLYKGIVMDANGKILPCSASPQPDKHLSFAQFPDATDSFNSPDHQRARQYFADGTRSDPAVSRAPHCENCDWDQSQTEVDYEQLAQYFRAVGRSLMDDAAVRMLCDW